jgi:hypothetical protein
MTVRHSSKYNAASLKIEEALRATLIEDATRRQPPRNSYTDCSDEALRGWLLFFTGVVFFVEKIASLRPTLAHLKYLQAKVVAEVKGRVSDS